MKKDDIKKILILILIFLIILLIVFLLSKNTQSKDKVEPEKNYAYVLINHPNAQLKFYKNEWNYITDTTQRNYDLYRKNQKLGNYSVAFNNDSFNITGLDKIAEIDDNFTGVNTDINYKFINLTTGTLNDYDKNIIQSYLSKDNIIFGTNGESIDKYVFSIDDKIGYLYFVTNAYLTDVTINNAYTIIFSVIDNNVKVLYKDIKENDNTLSVCYPIVNSLLKIDNVNYLLYTCMYFSNKGSIINVASFDNNQFDNIFTYDYKYSDN